MGQFTISAEALEQYRIQVLRIFERNEHSLEEAYLILNEITENLQQYLGIEIRERIEVPHEDEMN